MAEQEREHALAESLGFTCEHDKSRGSGWSRFKRGNVYVWLCRDMRWARAILGTDGFYRAHLYFDTIEEALNGEKGARDVR